MAAKLTKLTHKIAIQQHLVTAVPFADLAPGGQSVNFWIYARTLCWSHAITVVTQTALTLHRACAAGGSQTHCI
jgi:hypothetical protein